MTKISGEKEVTVNHAGCVQLDRFRNKENVLQMFPFTRVSVALLYCLHIRKHGIYTRETPGLYLLVQCENVEKLSLRATYFAVLDGLGMIVFSQLTQAVYYDLSYFTG